MVVRVFYQSIERRAGSYIEQRIESAMQSVHGVLVAEHRVYTIRPILTQKDVVAQRERWDMPSPDPLAIAALEDYKETTQLK